MSKLSVAKFGGTSVANFEAMSLCANIVTQDPNTRVVVLSASAGVTNYLVELANGCDKERRNEIITAVRTIQYNIIEKLQHQSEISAQIDKLLARIEALAESASLATSTALADELISHGEMMSTKIFTQLCVERNYPAVWVDVREIVATNSHYGKAVPNDEKTKLQSDAILKPLIAEGKVAITQGFIGRDAEGKTTTLGRGGSDYSGLTYQASTLQIHALNQMQNVSIQWHLTKRLKWQPLGQKYFTLQPYYLLCVVISQYSLVQAKRQNKAVLG